MAQLISLGAMIDHTIDHYRHHFKELIGISLWMIVASAPFLLAKYIAPLGVDVATPMNETIAYAAMNSIGFITTVLASFWVSVCLVLTIRARANGNTPDHATLGKQSWKMIPGLLIVSLIITVGIVLACALALAPGLLLTMLNPATGALGDAVGILGGILLIVGIVAALYFTVRVSIELSLSQYIYILETEGNRLSPSAIKHALVQSRAYVRGKWWSVFLRLVIPSVLVALLVFAVTFVMNIGITVLMIFAAASFSALAVKLSAIFLTLNAFVINALAVPLYSLVGYYLYDSIAKR